jgi:hypothetical protein
VRNSRPVLRSEMFGLRNRIRFEINSLRHRRKSVSRNGCVGMLSVQSGQIPRRRVRHTELPVPCVLTYATDLHTQRNGC